MQFRELRIIDFLTVLLWFLKRKSWKWNKIDISMHVFFSFDLEFCDVQVCTVPFFFCHKKTSFIISIISGKLYCRLSIIDIILPHIRMREWKVGITLLQIIIFNIIITRICIIKFLREVSLGSDQTPSKLKQDRFNIITQL